MSYVRPAHNAADATWQGATPTVRPAHDAADATWQQQGGPAAVAMRAASASPLAASAARLAPITQARAQSASPLATSAAHLAVLDDAVRLRAASPSPLGTSAAHLAPVTVARARSASPLAPGAAQIAPVLQARARSSSPLGASRAALTHLRYEIRGAVRQQGVALARTVRCHRLSDGALLGEAATVAGQYRVPAGLVEGDLCYLVPLDLEPGAADYRPVAANRVPAVLADDLAEVPA